MPSPLQFCLFVTRIFYNLTKGDIMRIVRELIIVMIASISVVYLFLPSLLPDIVPLVGWIDEGLATTIMLSALKHWGLDLTGLFGSPDKPKETEIAKNQDVLLTDDNGQTQKIRIPREVLERAIQDYQREQAMRS